LSALRQPSQERYVRFAFAKYRTKEIATPKVDRHAQSGQLAVLKDKSEPHTEVRQLAVLTEESDICVSARTNPECLLSPCPQGGQSGHIPHRR
jgi:hypothetical protein